MGLRCKSSNNSISDAEGLNTRSGIKDIHQTGMCHNAPHSILPYALQLSVGRSVRVLIAWSVRMPSFLFLTICRGGNYNHSKYVWRRAWFTNICCTFLVYHDFRTRHDGLVPAPSGGGERRHQRVHARRDATCTRISGPSQVQGRNLRRLTIKWNLETYYKEIR